MTLEILRLNCFCRTAQISRSTTFSDCFETGRSAASLPRRQNKKCSRVQTVEPPPHLPHSLFLKVPILSLPFIFYLYLSGLIRSPAAPRAASSLVSFIYGPTPINSSWRQRKPTEWSSTVPWRTPRTTKKLFKSVKTCKNMNV